MNLLSLSEKAKKYLMYILKLKAASLMNLNYSSAKTIVYNTRNFKLKHKIEKNDKVKSDPKWFYSRITEKEI